jgi:NADPH:quinone reductase-like Zn-dependent oxidoreductase
VKAVTYTQYGGPENLTYGDVDDPKVGPDWVRVAVRAASVNPVDWKLASGGLDSALDVFFPVVPGWDVAGVVTEVGPANHDLKIGDEVYGYLRKDAVHGGTYAEQVAAPRATLALKPTSLSFEEAAAVPLAGLTAFQALEDALQVGVHDVVLVHGASGGVGVFAVQVAAARGARVIGTASPRNHDFVRELGAEPVEYGEGLAERVRALVPDGVTAVLDTRGEDALASAPDVLADQHQGRVASIIDPGVAELGGTYVFVHPDVDDLAALATLADAGELRVPIASTYPLERAADAWRESMEGHARGKIVLTVG